MQGSNRLTLHYGPFELILAPRMGGAIAGFYHHGPEGCTPILRGSREEPAQILAAASFPLVPFVNRIRNGRFHFGGREVVLAPNLADDPSPLHGQGWTAEWQVERHGEAEAELSFRHRAGEWPWDYRAHQHFRLDARGLELRLSCRNLADAPMPCGLGQHPYFPCDAGTRIDTKVTHAWTIDARILPVEKVPAHGRFALADRAVCGQDLDHGFEGWGGTALIHAPTLPFAIEMRSPDAAFFQLYSPPGGGLFVAEPVTHRNAALNEPEAQWREAGLKVLEPGEEMALTMRLDLVER